ncbi:altered inheritance of mitochondria protein 21 isoform X2 [Anarrhichthys ocellatus]|nr:altered inheritance of mitochondria protein 21-like isoform X2 [Anarrhichthys ocellatus]XP_031705882.1 altered inheritance of mitochondria protein 21-like isoform X2 [Anarrhichthys ocellatus]XP_031705883.1 altered inheritance of mitochondria protein 21-like isoform X2 [Anarrhichthys ocellatus]XP_031705884.1 altered inheritance of mitochondria protein 21-like isoform X2 [Anarrhichthys ocellatus]XP_031705885.1 altered inheritance of mitochondria protein 21-like isoform X2 [Anarrhichthys ocella
MGNICCPPENPCGNAEERSVLLKDDSKAMVPAGGTIVGGTCGPGGDEDLRKLPDEADIKVEQAVQVKQSTGIAETEPNNTRENGPLQKEVMQTAAPSPSKGSDLKENSVGVQDEDMKDRPADIRQAEPMQCTLNSLQEHARADWVVVTATNAATEEENPVSEEDKIPDSSSPTIEAVCPEKPAETNATRELITVDNTTDNDDEAEESKVTTENSVAEPSGEVSHNNEVISVPNPRPSAAAGQTSSGLENDEESPSCAVTEDSDDGSSSVSMEGGPEVLKSHEVCDSPPGAEPTGLDHSGVERDSTNCVREPETTAPADASESSKTDQDAEPDVECSTTSSKEVTSLENTKQEIEEEMMVKGQDTEEDVPKVEEDEIKEEAEAETGKDAEIREVTGKEEQPAVSSSPDVNAGEKPVRKEEDSAEEGTGNSEEDLYRGAEELSASQHDKPETTVLKVEDRCSLGPVVEILSYSEREWKGNTAKSALIRKGYREMSQRFGCVRRVRGDNYCALRATLFQLLSHSTQLPAWLQEQDVNMLLKQLEAQEGLFSQWTFPGDCLQGDGTGDATLQLKGYMELLRNKWQAAVDCSSAVERQQLCERVFHGGEEELGLLEALKLLMMGRAVELHGCMMGGGDVPLFCWLLFARDSSDCPRSFLSNHLGHVGLSAGLEQVEMFLLGYALQCTIQVYRLYKADTDEFVTYYPDDHKDDWPSVCLVTEDDRHYNVPVVEAAEELHKLLGSS